MKRHIILLIASILCITATALFWNGDVRQNLEVNEQRGLTQPLRLLIDDSVAYENFILGLKVYHYRVKPRGNAAFRDVFYDTAAWDLYSHGFSYRFRTRLAADDSSYTVRLEQEPRFVLGNDKKIDLISRLPAELGHAISAGEWARAVTERVENSASFRLQIILKEIGVEPKDLQPRLLGELRRERFDITDRGLSWFELDHERWVFSPFEQMSDSSSVQYDDFVIDTRLKKKDPELLRRVNTMNQFANMMNGVRFSLRAPHERAIEEFGRNDIAANRNVLED